MSWENFNLESELKSINEISARGLTTWKDKLIDRYKQHSEEAEMIWTTIENDIKLNNSWRTYRNNYIRKYESASNLYQSECQALEEQTNEIIRSNSELETEIVQQKERLIEQIKDLQKYTDLPQVAMSEEEKEIARNLNEEKHLLKKSTNIIFDVCAPPNLVRAFIYADTPVLGIEYFSIDTNECTIKEIRNIIHTKEDKIFDTQKFKSQIRILEPEK